MTSQATAMDNNEESAIEALLSKIADVAPHRIAAMRKRQQQFKAMNAAYEWQENYFSLVLKVCQKGGDSEKRFFGEIQPQAEMSLDPSVVPRSFHGMTIDDVEERPDMPMFGKSMLYIRNYLTVVRRQLQEGNGLTLCGDPGTGKSLLAAVITQAAEECRVSCEWYIASKLYDLLKQDEGDRFYNQIASCSLLVIDDLGNEYRTEWTLATLDRIISHRYEWKHSTIITTNFYREELEREYAPRVMDRLAERNKAFEFRGESWRRRNI